MIDKRFDLARNDGIGIGILNIKILLGNDGGVRIRKRQTTILT